MLIIEGSDCLGKTTLAEAISKQTKAKVQHMKRPDESTFDFFTDYKDIIHDGIQDRFHLGALAYHENMLSHTNRIIIEGFLLSIGSVIVILYASDYRWYEDRLRKDTRGSELTIEHQCDANQRFNTMVRYRKVYFDYAIDVAPTESGEPNYAMQSDAEHITKTWLERRKAAHKWMLNSRRVR